MKKAVIAILAAVCAIPAMAGDTYVGGSLGRAEQKMTVDGVGSLSESATSFALFGGYQFTKNIGAEVGYAQFGKVTIANGADSLRNEPSSFYAAVTGTMPLTSQLSAYGKLGVSRNHVKATVTQSGTTEAGSSNHTSAMIGLGVSYALNANVSLFGEYQNFGKVFKEDGGNLKVDQVSAGVRYQF